MLKSDNGYVLVTSWYNSDGEGNTGVRMYKNYQAAIDNFEDAISEEYDMWLKDHLESGGTTSLLCRDEGDTFMSWEVGSDYQNCYITLRAIEFDAEE